MTLLKIFGNPDEPVIVPSKVTAFRDADGEIQQTEGELDYRAVNKMLMSKISGGGWTPTGSDYENIAQAQQAAAFSQMLKAATSPPPSYVQQAGAQTSSQQLKTTTVSSRIELDDLISVVNDRHSLQGGESKTISLLKKMGLWGPLK